MWHNPMKHRRENMNSKSRRSLLKGKSRPRTRHARSLAFEPLEERALLAIMLAGDATWISQGQGPVTGGQVILPPSNQVAGAIQAIAPHPSDANTMFVATVNGGIWRTVTATAANPSWAPLTDDFASLSLGDIAYSPLDATNNTLFAGTGQFDNGSRGGPAVGLYRTTDGGNNWAHLDPTPGNPLNGLRITSVVPTSIGTSLADQVVLVSTVNNGGIFRSTDGGGSFTQISGGVGTGLPGGSATDLIVDPNNNMRFYAALPGQGVFRSDDGGVVWAPINTGLVFAGSNNIELAAHDAGASTVIYAGVVNGGVLANVYRDPTAGSGWTVIGTPPAIHTGSQGFNNFSIVADPGNANLVYVGGDRQASSPFVGNLFIGNASANTWSSIVQGGANNTAPHADSRAMVFDANGNIIESDDGGIYRLTSPSTGARVWSSVNGNIQTAEYNSLAYDNVNNILFGGTQDTGSSEQSASGSPTWSQISQGDGGTQAVYNLGASIIRFTMGNNFGTFLRRTFDNTNNQVGGDVQLALNGLATDDMNFQGFSVFAYDVNNVDSTGMRMLIGGLTTWYESADRGDNLTDITPAGAGRISAIAYGGTLGGAANEEVAYVGDNNGNLYLRTAAGGGAAFNQLNNYPGGAPRDIALDPDNWQRAYVVDSSNTYFTPDAGNSWTNLTGNLDVIASNYQSVELFSPDPTSIGDTVLVGGLGGVFRTLNPDDGPAANWTNFGSNLPNAIVRDVQYDATDDRLLAGTYGRSAWRITSVSDALQQPTILNIAGDEEFVNQDDVIRLVRNASNPLLLDVFLNNNTATPNEQFDLATIEQINVFGQGGNDQLIVDSSNSLINVPGGIRYDGDGLASFLYQGGDGADGQGLFGFDRGFDTLTLTQNGGETYTSEMLGVGALPGSGVSTIEGLIGNQPTTQTVYFEELEPVTTDVPAMDFAITSVPGLASLLQDDNQITYSNGQLIPVGPGTSARIVVDNFEPIEFMNKTNATVDAGAGDDTFATDAFEFVPTGLESLTVHGDAGNDVIRFGQHAQTNPATLSVTLDGGAGDDLIDGSGLTNLSSVPLIINGASGNDVLIGGRGDDTLDGGDGDDLLVGGQSTGLLGIGDNTYLGGNGFDTIGILGTAAADTIDVLQNSATGLSVTINGNLSNESMPSADIEEARIEAKQGDDLIRLTIADGLFAPAATPQTDVLRFDVIGGGPNASDWLNVVDDGLGDTIIQRLGADQRSGTISIAPAHPNGAAPSIVYSEMERVDITPINPITAGTGSDGLGRLVVFKNDPFESNNTLPTATFLGAGATINVDPTIDPGGINFFNIPGDNDFYQFVAADTGTLDFQVYFDQIAALANGRAGLPGNGDLNVEIYDSDGLPAAIGAGTALVDGAGNTIGEQVAIPVVRNETYFMRVLGATAEAVNVYNFTVINVPGPIPQVVDLQAATDSGRNNTDDITFFDANLNGASVFDIVLDDDRIDEFTNLNLLPDTTDDDLPTAGFDYGVEVFNNGSSVGYAYFVGGNLWRFTATAGDLNEGDQNFVSAAVWLRDPADPAALGRVDLSLPLQMTLDTIVPPANFGIPTDSDGLADDSDTGVVTMPATFTDRITSDTTPHLVGQAEADAIIKVYADANLNGTIDAGDPLLGQTTSVPLDGNLAEPQGFWELVSVVDLNDPSLFATRDGLRRLLVSAEDVAGNVNLPDDGVGDDLQVLEIFIDTQGPQVDNVFVTDDPAYDLFDPKPSVDGPTPLVRSITIDFVDQPDRLAADFLYDALKADIATSPGNYLLTGDHVGIIAIDTVAITASSVADGLPATASVTLTFVQPLPDDRFTLTISENLVDPVGNNLDGESNASEPLETPQFPSGDGVPGGDFIARFTIDSRPEIGSYVSKDIDLDINGNFVWDPANGQIGNDATNVDLTFTLPVANPDGSIGLGGFNVHDLLFAGQFASLEEPEDGNGAGGGLPPSGFDQLAAYGNSAELGAFRWILDTNSDGVVNPADGDILSLQPELADFNVAGAIPVAGNLDRIAANGDEIGLYNFGTWVFDGLPLNPANRDFVLDTSVDTVIQGSLLGLPIVGDFDGDGLDDLGVFNNNVFTFDLANDGFGAQDLVPGIDPLKNDLDAQLVWGFPGVLDKPVAADMDQDGIDDIGLWVPRDSASLPQGVAEWHFLLSDDFVVPGGAGNRVTGTVNTLDHPFEPVPFGNDLYAEFGDELAMPIVGNFDPPVSQQAVPDPAPNFQETADFDADGDVDGFDFLAWQRGFGLASPSAEVSLADGDANADGAVDGDDLSRWQTEFGSLTASSAELVGQQEVVAALTADSGAETVFGDSSAISSPPASFQQAGQAALARLGRLNASSQRTTTPKAAIDEVFQHWQPHDLEPLTYHWLSRPRIARHPAHEHDLRANRVLHGHHQNARDRALEDRDTLAAELFSMARPWRG